MMGLVGLPPTIPFFFWLMRRGIAPVWLGLSNWDAWMRLLTWQDYNTRVVVIGTSLLGLAAGLIGSFALLRKRALMGDALAHASLPGICIAFLIGTLMGGDGKSLPFLLLGAATSGMLGMIAILIIRKTTKLKEDAALGIVLSVFFGMGITLLTLVQQLEAGSAAGLESFIYGKTASMVAFDAWVIGIAALMTIGFTSLFFKELQLLCFDEGFAGSQGFRVVMLDVLLMGQVIVITMVGLQAVGLVLMIALLVIPAASARFWTDRLRPMAWGAAVLGAFASCVGSAASALWPKLPSGAMIVLGASTFFLFSLLFGAKRGFWIRWRMRLQVARRVDQQHLLRALFEIPEQRSFATSRWQVDDRNNDSSRETTSTHPVVTEQELLHARSWSRRHLLQCVAREVKLGNVVRTTAGTFRLTSTGRALAARLVREHRLWELYLITHADIAPSRVDHEADAIEHVLAPEMIAELESLLADRLLPGESVPPDPHREVNSLPQGEVQDR